METILGKVIVGKKRGKSLGFPTANVHLEIIIPEGIYISKTMWDNKKYRSVTFIGRAETFGETYYQAETYLLEFDHDLYGKTIKIELLSKIRESHKFDSWETLVSQMKDDVNKTREYFIKNPL